MSNRIHLANSYPYSVCVIQTVPPKILHIKQCFNNSFNNFMIPDKKVTLETIFKQKQV